MHLFIPKRDIQLRVEIQYFIFCVCTCSASLYWDRQKTESFFYSLHERENRVGSVCSQPCQEIDRSAQSLQEGPRKTHQEERMGKTMQRTHAGRNSAEEKQEIFKKQCCDESREEM